MARVDLNVGGAVLLLVLLASLGCTGAPTHSPAAGEGGSGGGSNGASGASDGAGGWPACVDPPTPEAFELGTGETCFERLVPGQIVPRIAGHQGGRHVWAAIGCADCEAPILLELGIADPQSGDAYPGTSPQQQVVVLDPDGWHQLGGLRAYLPPLNADTIAIPVGTTVLLRASVIEGRSVKHAAEIPIAIGGVEAGSK